MPLVAAVSGSLARLPLPRDTKRSHGICLEGWKQASKEAALLHRGLLTLWQAGWRYYALTPSL